jgi:hypothetical protein
MCNDDENLDFRVHELAEWMLEAHGMNRRVIFLIGAGVSQTLGIPSTMDLRKKLLDKPAVVAMARKTYKLQPGMEPSFEMLCWAMRARGGWRILEGFLKEEIWEKRVQHVSPTLEILSHLVRNRLVDHIVSMNFDDLLEESLADEMGETGYRRITSKEDFGLIEQFLDDQEDKNKLPLVLRPHGSLFFGGEHIQVDPHEIEKFPVEIENALRVIFKKAHVVVLGYACQDRDMLTLLLDQRNNHEIVNLTWVDTKKGKNFLPEGLSKIAGTMLLTHGADRFMEALAEAVNEKARSRLGLEGTKRPIYTFSRHKLRAVLFAQQKKPKAVAPYNSYNRLLLEILIYAIKARGRFTLRGLARCERIARLSAKLSREEKNIITPHTILNDLSKNKVLQFRNWPDADGELPIVLSKAPNDLADDIQKLFRFKSFDKECKKHFIDTASVLSETFDIDLTNREQTETTFLFKEPIVIRDHMELIKETRQLLENATTDICSVSETGEWLTRPEYKKYFPKKARLVLARHADDKDSQHGKRVKAVFHDLKKIAAGNSLDVRWLPWNQHDIHMTLSDKRAIYFAREAKTTSITAVLLTEKSDLKQLSECFKNLWKLAKPLVKK